MIRASSLFLLAAIGVFQCSPAPAQTVSGLNDLARLTKPQLNALFMSSQSVTTPGGKVRGLPLMNPGARFAVPVSRGGRLLWQGKVFHPQEATVVNRFFGVRVVRGALSTGPSRLDGRPALVIDYSQTSRVYRRYRDELREVAPGLYLGLMFDRNDPAKGPVQYFALQSE